MANPWWYLRLHTRVNDLPNEGQEHGLLLAIFTNLSANFARSSHFVESLRETGKARVEGARRGQMVLHHWHDDDKFWQGEGKGIFQLSNKADLIQLGWLELDESS